MKWRFQAFGLHLMGSVCVLFLIVGGLYFGWYRWPGWYLVEVLRVILLVVLVDLVIGPTLTFVVASPGKPRRVLARDVVVIVTVQIVALVYGAITLWQGRPLYYTFSADRLEIVRASDLESAEIALAQRQNPTLAPHWYSLPRRVWAPLPDDPQLAAQIVNSTLFGGNDIIDMPRYFKPWNQALPQLRTKLGAVADMQGLTKPEKAHLTARMAALGLTPEKHNALIMWGDVRRVLVVFDPDSLRIRAILKIP